MIDIDNKIKKFQNNCIETATREANSLKESIDNKINSKIEDEIASYREEAVRKYNRQISKLEKNYNSKIYELNNNSNISILNKRRELSDTLKLEVKLQILNFVNSDKYFEFLIDNIKSSILEIGKHGESLVKIYLTQNDKDKYENKISSYFNFDIDSISNDFIGGSICVGVTKNISIDNTLKTLIEEQFINI